MPDRHIQGAQDVGRFVYTVSYTLRVDGSVHSVACSLSLLVEKKKVMEERKKKVSEIGERMERGKKKIQRNPFDSREWDREREKKRETERWIPRKRGDRFFFVLSFPPRGRGRLLVLNASARLYAGRPIRETNKESLAYSVSQNFKRFMTKIWSESFVSLRTFQLTFYLF